MNAWLMGGPSSSSRIDSRRYRPASSTLAYKIPEMVPPGLHTADLTAATTYLKNHAKAGDLVMGEPELSFALGFDSLFER
jgi:hypothetical protein